MTSLGSLCVGTVRTHRAANRARSAGEPYGRVVVVVVVGTGQLAPVGFTPHASQQLEHASTTPPLSVHAVTLLFVPHLKPPLPSSLQQVTNPGLPHADRAAHFLTPPLHVLGR